MALAACFFSMCFTRWHTGKVRIAVIFFPWLEVFKEPTHRHHWGVVLPAAQALPLPGKCPGSVNTWCNMQVSAGSEGSSELRNGWLHLLLLPHTARGGVALRGGRSALGGARAAPGNWGSKNDEQHFSKRKDFIEDSPCGMIDLLRKSQESHQSK